MPSEKEIIFTYNKACALYNKDQEESLKLFHQVIPHLDKLHDHRRSGIAYKMAAVLTSQLGKPDDALALGRKSRTILENAEFRDVLLVLTKTYYSLAKICLFNKLLPEAEENINKAFAYFSCEPKNEEERVVFYKCLHIRAGIVLAQGHKAEAKKLLLKVMKDTGESYRGYNAKEEYADILFDEEKYDEAFRIYGEVLKYDPQRPFPYIRRAWIHWQTDKAVNEARQAIKLVEDKMRTINNDDFRRSHLEQEHEVYDLAIQIFLRHDMHEDAFETIQKIKARTTTERILGASQGKNDIYSDYIKLSGRLESSKTFADYDEKTDIKGVVRQERAFFREMKRLKQEHHSYYSYADIEPKIKKLSDITSRLDETTACLDFFVGDTVLTLFFIMKGRFEKCAIPYKRTELEKEINNIIRLVRKENGVNSDISGETADAYNVITEILYDNILKDILERNPQIVNLVIIPHSLLNKLSFSFLPEKYIISFLPGAALFDNYGKWKQMPKLEKLAVFSNSLGDLRFASKEAALVSKMFKHTDKFDRKDCTVKNFRANAERADVLHIACHAHFYDDDPKKSCIDLLGRDGTKREFMTGDVLSMDFSKVALVVLSCCKSGLTGQHITDDTLSLPRAFMIRGALRIVATFGKIDDPVTAELMTEFYNNMLTYKYAPAKALRMAQLKIKQTHPHPYFWAGFQYYGA